MHCIYQETAFNPERQINNPGARCPSLPSVAAFPSPLLCACSMLLKMGKIPCHAEG